MKLDELQMELLDRWVAEQAGGLIVVAGPVFTPQWAGMRRGRDPRIDTIKTLVPVVFLQPGFAEPQPGAIWRRSRLATQLYARWTGCGVPLARGRCDRQRSGLAVV